MRKLIHRLISSALQWLRVRRHVHRLNAHRSFYSRYLELPMMLCLCALMIAGGIVLMLLLLAFYALCIGAVCALIAVAAVFVYKSAMALLNPLFALVDSHCASSIWLCLPV